MNRTCQLHHPAASDQTDPLRLIVQPLLDWFDVNQRILPWREDPTPYHVWISEIMLQQTRVSAVISYYNRFLQVLPDIQSLAEVSDDELMKLWQGLGYYSRARNLKKTAGICAADHDGRLPADYKELLKLPGIGPYTAGAIASIAFGIARPAVDGNVLRVIARILADQRDIADPAVKKDMESMLQALMESDSREGLHLREMPGLFNQALMELGALVCLPNGEPRCPDCPVRGVCRACLQELTDRIPYKAPKKARKIEKKTVLIIENVEADSHRIQGGADGADRDSREAGLKIAMRKRPEDGLLAGLYEFPSLEGHLTDRQIESYVKDMGTLEHLETGPDARHVFTHIEWHMKSYHVQLSRTDQSGLQFYTPDQIREELAVPSAYAAYLKYMDQLLIGTDTKKRKKIPV